MSEQQVILYCIYGLGFLLVLSLIKKVYIRLRLSRAKHPSLRGHSKWSRKIAKHIKFFDYSLAQFFSADGAPEHIALQRQGGLKQLTEKTTRQSVKTIEQLKGLSNSISDIQFTSHYRVPFPFRTHLPEVFKLGSIIDESQGAKVKDLDGEWRFDLSGAYGVNVFGYDFYKSCIEEGNRKVNSLGPALGAYHPLIGETVDMINNISGLDEVSFHMSGTEAVMQAVRLARYHTKKTHLVRFCGAYHGWWDGVQPGIGNHRVVNDVYTLADLSEHTVKVLETRTDIACVLINPLQAFHPNADSASDSTLIASERSTNFDKAAYTAWLQRIRDICTARGIVLIFDEVFAGFRLGYRGAQEYFSIKADMVTYGKTLGGGLPVGVLSGRSDLMKRFQANKPVDVSFARGTFNSHPYVIGAMHTFLKRIQQDDMQAIYQQVEQQWDSRVQLFNQRLTQANLPIKITNMHSVLSVLYTQPGHYNWMLQFYLRANGLELSWLGSGRMIMNFTITDSEFDEIISLFIDAAHQMKSHGWLWSTPQLTNKVIKRQFLHNMLAASFPVLARFLPHTLSSPINGIAESTETIINNNSPAEDRQNNKVQES